MLNEYSTRMLCRQCTLLQHNLAAKRYALCAVWVDYFVTLLVAVILTPRLAREEIVGGKGVVKHCK